MMNRRNFLRTGGALSLAGGLAGPALATSSRQLSQLLSMADNERVLVLIQLTGGNDGLNTLVPRDQLSVLNQVRPHVMLPESSLLPLGPGSSRAFHPSLTGFRNLWREGKLGIVQSVGYPNQNRSHFRSTDIWSTASPSEVEYTTGWMGRYLELENPGYPEGYPSQRAPHPLAITMGNAASETCQGTVTNVCQTVNDPFRITYLAPGGDTPLPGGRAGEEIFFLRTAIAQTNAYGAGINEAAEAGDSKADYPNTRFAEQLRNVARMIHGGLQTKVYVVSMGGYDTHASQVANSNTEGKHAELLSNLGDSLVAFQDDLEQLGLADRVLGMTYSEFGRRIRSNASNGTDHGDAAPLFFFGACAGGAVLGENPTVDPAVEQWEGVPMQYDFRDVYGSVLQDWFGLEESSIRNLLYPDFQYLPVASGCAAGVSLPVEMLSLACTGKENYIELAWQTGAEVDNKGFEVERSPDGRDFSYHGWVAGTGSHSNYTFEDRDVTVGQPYYYRLRQIDYDGDYAHSHIVSGRLSGSAVGRWTVGNPYPNPAVERTQVKIYAPTDGTLRYAILDAAGRKLWSDSQALAGRGDRMVEIPTARLATGAYTLQFAWGQQRATKSLVVR